MSKETYFLRTTSPANPAASFEQRFEAVVDNTGNYFFEEALERHLKNVTVVHSFDELPPKYDKLILSMSNFISPSTDLGWFCDKIEEKKYKDIVMIGAGCQSDSYRDGVKLTKGTKRFLELVSDKSHSIGVRGYYTANILSDHGIKNVEVIGCPTAFWTAEEPVIQRTRAAKKIAIHCTPTGYYRDKIGSLFAHGIEFDASYIIQSEKWMLPLIEKNFESRRDLLLTDDEIRYYSWGFCDPVAVESWIKNNGRIFFGMEEWISSMKDFDFVYGSRFHGNMAAIQAGVPALNMPFDTRTRELCEYLNLPHLPLENFDCRISPDELRDMADFSAYSRTYQSRLKSYKLFLFANGIKFESDEGERGSATVFSRKIMTKFISLLVNDFSDGLISKENFLKEIELRIRDERSLKTKQKVERGVMQLDR